jgi:hypothetical protein
MSRYRRRALRFLWLLLVMALVVGVWQLSSLLRINTFDVRATVQAPQPGITQVVAEDGGSTNGTAPLTDNAGFGNIPQGIGIADATLPRNGGSSAPMLVQSGGQGNLIYINTPIDYGTVFPGEELTGFFTVHLNVDENVTYTVNITANTTGGYLDMRPYLVVQKDPGEGEDEPDATANGTSGDWYASGNLTDVTDESDKWWVTFYVPIELGDYQADIYVVPKDKTTVD